MRLFSIGLFVLLILLAAGTIPLGAANKADSSEALLSAESAYNNASIKNREVAREAFVGLLLDSIGSEERIVRRRATYMLNVYFSEDPEVLHEILQFIELEAFKALRTEGRVNALHLLTDSGNEAWDQGRIAVASERLEEIVKDPPADWGPKQAEYLQTFRNRITQLAERPAAVSAFGTIQESDPNAANFTDIDLFICEASHDDEDLVVETRSLAERLAERGFGRVRLRVWPADAGIPASELSGHSTLFFDEFLPEAKEVGRVEEIFAESSGLPSFRAVPNQGEATSWYLTLFVCPVTGEQTIAPSRLWLHIQRDAQKDLAVALLDEVRGETLAGAAIDVRPIRMVTIGPNASQLRYFKRGDEDEARILFMFLQGFVPGLELVDMSENYKQYDWIDPGHYELWLSPDLVELLTP